jgi:hypothetical protein
MLCVMFKIIFIRLEDILIIKRELRRVKDIILNLIYGYFLNLFFVFIINFRAQLLPLMSPLLHVPFANSIRIVFSNLEEYKMKIQIIS